MSERKSALSKNLSDKATYSLTKTLVDEISSLIDEARQHVAREYNLAQASLCWLVGHRINEEILKAERAEYGEAIITSLAQQLTLTYGKGYSRPNLFRMIKFAKQSPERAIVSTLSRQLSWSHFVIICAIEDSLKRTENMYVISLGISVHKPIENTKHFRDFGLLRWTPKFIPLLMETSSDVVEQQVSQLLSKENYCRIQVATDNKISLDAATKSNIDNLIKIGERCIKENSVMIDKVCEDLKDENCMEI